MSLSFVAPVLYCVRNHARAKFVYLYMIINFNNINEILLEQNQCLRFLQRFKVLRSLNLILINQPVSEHPSVVEFRSYNIG